MRKKRRSRRKEDLVRGNDELQSDKEHERWDDIAVDEFKNKIWRFYWNPRTSHRAACLVARWQTTYMLVNTRDVSETLENRSEKINPLTTMR